MRTGYTPDHLELIALRGIPAVEPGDALSDLVSIGLASSGLALCDDDVLVVAQKIVSKAEGRLVRLADVVPSPEACRLADLTGKDPRLVELILAESRSVLRQREGLLIVEHRLGFVMANAGVDQSNVRSGHALLLPEDPDRSARALRQTLAHLTGAEVGVIINDSLGRAWRRGTVGHAIGVAGVLPVADLRRTPDLFDRPLQVTEVAIADEIAAAASLLMGQAAEAKPVVLVRGLRALSSPDGVERLLRPASLDLFR